MFTNAFSAHSWGMMDMVPEEWRHRNIPPCFEQLPQPKVSLPVLSIKTLRTHEVHSIRKYAERFETRSGVRDLILGS